MSLVIMVAGVETSLLGRTATGWDFQKLGTISQWSD
jgi:hypothetical protein